MNFWRFGSVCTDPLLRLFSLSTVWHKTGHTLLNLDGSDKVYDDISGKEKESLRNIINHGSVVIVLTKDI